MRTRLVCAAFCCVAAAAFAAAPDKGLEGDPKASEIRALIDALVSPNPPAVTGDEDRTVAPDYKLPPDYDKSKQKPVREAISKLRSMGPVAFPYLVERWNDKRYCVTVEEPLSEYNQNASVGEICESIVFDQLQPYGIWPRMDDDPRGHPKRPMYPGAFLDTQEVAKKWCETHKGKSLFELQTMVLDWVVEQEDAHTKDYTKEELEFVHGLQAELKRRGEPMRPRSYVGQRIAL